MKKIAVINHKGGVGKTTSVQNIGACMALKGLKVLLVDTDPQANLTESFGIFNQEKSIYQSFSKGDSLPIISIKENIDLIPSSLEFAGIELEISSRMAREKILDSLLKPLKGKYDICLIDCPPSLGLITINALVASDSVLIPMEAEFLAYRGINSIVSIISSVKEHFNDKLEILGVFFTNFNKSRVLTQGIKEEVKKYFGSALLDTVIRVNVAIAESQSNGKSVLEYDIESNGAKDYINLVNEILEK